MADTGRRGHASGDAQLVGREPQLERILANLAALETGRGRLVLVAGEAGIGKSRLARELVDRARAIGAPTFIGRCVEQHTSVPYFPFIELLQSAFAAAPDHMLVEARRRWPELALLVPEFDTEFRLAPRTTAALKSSSSAP